MSFVATRRTELTSFCTQVTVNRTLHCEARLSLFGQRKHAIAWLYAQL